MDEQSVFVAHARCEAWRPQPDAVRLDLDRQLRAPLEMESPAHRLWQHNASRCIDGQNVLHGNYNGNWNGECQSNECLRFVSVDPIPAPPISSRVLAVAETLEMPPGVSYDDVREQYLWEKLPGAGRAPDPD